MAGDNFGSQRGDGSVNVGVGDFRGATVTVTHGRPPFTPEQLQVCRHFAFGRRGLKSESLSTFGIVAGLASLAGLYFTVFAPFAQPKLSSWSHLLLFSFGVGVLSFVTSRVLRRRKFESFAFRKYYLEAGSRDRIYVTSFTAKCPWCGARMKLRNVGPKDGPRNDLFICERNPRQHTVELDPTYLPEIASEF